MDWTSPSPTKKKPSKKTGKAAKAKNRRQPGTQKAADADKTLTEKIQPALTEPANVWSDDFARTLEKLVWPKGVTAESTFLFSALIQEQAEVLAHTGVSSSKLATILPAIQDGSAEEQGGQLEQQAFQWLEKINESPSAALATIALAWQIVEHARQLDSEWLSKWTLAVLEMTQSSELDEESCILTRLAVRCELPLLMTVVTASQTSLAEAIQAMDNLAEYLECAAEDSSAWIHEGASYLRAELASVLRCRVLADAIGFRGLYAPQQKAIAELLIHASRWARPDGTQLLAADSTAPKAQAVWDALASQTRNPKKLSATMILSGLAQGKRSEAKESVPATKLPALTQYRESAACAVAQSDWRNKGCRLAIDYSKANMCIEALGPKGKTVLAGKWTLDFLLEGKQQSQTGNWQEVCWFSDQDVDYLELETQFGNGIRVQRQLALLRAERLLYLSDSVLAEKECELSLESRIPMGPASEFAPAEKTTEGFIESDAGKSLALPLFLPEWRRQVSIANSRDSFTSVGSSLVAKVHQNAKRFYNPVLISLCSSHAKQAFTWRHLTVADELRIVRPEEARAFRVQFGSDQLFVYRNLDKPVRRTALGFHTFDDFFIGRFDAEDGEMDTIVQVEATASSLA
ncbi:MAG: hypothetical protein AAF394_03725 [Planctomycetota bacterium]